MSCYIKSIALHACYSSGYSSLIRFSTAISRSGYWFRRVSRLSYKDLECSSLICFWVLKAFAGDFYSSTLNISSKIFRVLITFLSFYSYISLMIFDLSAFSTGSLMRYCVLISSRLESRKSLSKPSYKLISGCYDVVSTCCFLDF